MRMQILNLSFCKHHYPISIQQNVLAIFMNGISLQKNFDKQLFLMITPTQPIHLDDSFSEKKNDTLTDSSPFSIPLTICGIARLIAEYSVKCGNFSPI